MEKEILLALANKWDRECEEPKIEDGSDDAQIQVVGPFEKL